MSQEIILDVQNLKTSFFNDRKELRAVDDVSFTVRSEECVAIIGESGCGKSVSALSILRLIPYPPGIIRGGQVFFKGRDLMKLSNSEMEQIRGSEISMIFQEPGTALNPVMPIGKQITENILTHTNLTHQQATARAVELLERMDISNARQRIKDYPHQFSGGMQQRAMIAMAMSCQPALLIADEPTTALDVTVQAQVLEQLNQLRKDFGTALIIITHNLGVVARYADTVIIMYGGRVAEQGTAEDVFENPLHPYTIGLINAVPRLDLPKQHHLNTIEGEPPDMTSVLPESCPFEPRCSRAIAICKSSRPQLDDYGNAHRCACFNIAGAKPQVGEEVNL